MKRCAISLQAGTLRHLARHRAALLLLCQNDGSRERADFALGLRPSDGQPSAAAGDHDDGADRGVVRELAGAAPADVARAAREERVDVLIDLCGHAGSSDLLEVQ